MAKNLHGSKRKAGPGTTAGSGVRKNRAGKNCKAKGRHINADKATRQVMGKGLTGLDVSEDSKNAYHEFHEADRRDRRKRMKRLEASERRAQAEAAKDRPDTMRVPLLEAALKSMSDAQTLQRLFVAASLKFVAKRGWPFFYIKRLHKLGNRPITVLP
jgi:hypothetical protein